MGWKQRGHKVKGDELKQTELAPQQPKGLGFEAHMEKGEKALGPSQVRGCK